MSQFQWNPKRTQAAIRLADGQTQTETATELRLDRRTLYRWMQEPAFSEEVDRLSVMMGVASRAERLRICKRLIAQRVRDDVFVQSDKDLLDWLKYAQSETDGIKLELTAVADAYASVAGERSD